MRRGERERERERESTKIIYTIYGDTSVCLEVSISNVIPESLDICPQLHLKQISQSSGITLLIHTPPDTHTGVHVLVDIILTGVNFMSVKISSKY